MGAAPGGLLDAVLQFVSPAANTAGQEAVLAVFQVVAGDGA